MLLKLLGVHPVVVHGGGPQISRMLERAGVKSTFIDGLRVTDAATMEVAEMVLSGAINKEIANWITHAGATADVRGVGLSGKDAGLITVEKATRTRIDPGLAASSRSVDLGFVGEPTRIDPKLMRGLIYSEDDYIPVIAPIGVAEDGQTYNINADTVAGALAGALKAKRMLLLTDVAGVLDAEGELVRQLTVAEARAADRRRRRHRRHDPQAARPPSPRWRPASRPWSSSTAAGRTPCWWSCSPSTAPARWCAHDGANRRRPAPRRHLAVRPRQHPLPGGGRAVGEIGERITDYVADVTGLPQPEAYALQKK